MRALGLFSLLLGLGWLTPTGAPAQTAVRGPDAVQFDRLIEEVERGDRIVSSPQEVRAMVRRLEALRPGDDALRELRLRGFRCDYDDLGPPASGLAFARAGLVDAQRLGDVGAQIRFRLCESNYIDSSGQTSQSLLPLEAALGLARQHDDPRLLAQALSRRGSMRSLLGEQAAALSDFLEAQRVYGNAGLRKEAEVGLLDIAVAYRRMGDHDKAQEYLRQGIAFAEREGDWTLLSASLLQYAFVYLDRGRPDQALAPQQRAVQIALDHGLDYYAAAAYMALATTQVSQGDFDGAQISLANAREGFDRLGERSTEGMLQLLEGQVRAGRGEHGEALSHYREAARAFAANPNPRYQVDLYAARARSYEALGNYRAAMDDLKLERTGRQKLHDEVQTQQSLLLQYQFDTARRDLENARLQAERHSQQQRLDAIERANRWQLAALVTGGLLMALLVFVMLQQRRRARRISALALTDALTGVANRRRIEAAAAEAVTHARNGGTPLAVLTFDLDWFKRINDSHGHSSGDQVLMRMARACEAALRRGDLLGRVGGEEFVVLLPDTPLEAARQVAERLRESVERIDLSDIAPDLRITVSIGVSLLRPQDDDVRDVIDRADAALYRAKGAGRNRVEVEA